MRFAVLSEHDAASWRAAHARGERSSALPYGIDALETKGHQLAFAKQSPSPRLRRAWAKIEHRIGGDVERPLRAQRLAVGADAVIGLLEQRTITAAAVRRKRVGPLGRRPLIMLSCWLAQWITTAGPSERSRLIDRYRGIDQIVVWSRNQIETLEEAGFARESLGAIPFGVDTAFYRGEADAPRSIDVLAVGQDSGRDYSTLFDAVRASDLTLDLVCRPENLRGLDVPENVRVHGTVPHARYRELLRSARVVAVPTHEFQYPTGQSVAMEAASAGAAVAVTGTRPMREYFDESVARLVDPGDAAGWRDALQDLLASDADRIRLAGGGQCRAVERFDTESSWAAFDRHLRAVGLTAPSALEGAA